MRSAAWDAWVAGAKAVDIVDFARRRPDLKLTASRGGRDLVGPCPECGGEDRFAITSTARKKVFRCRGCGAKGDVIKLVEFLDGVDFVHAVEKLTGRPPPPKPERKKGKGKIVAEYPYRDETGRLLFQTVRLEPKDFRQRRPDGRGGWIWNLDGARLVPYRLPEVVAAVKSGAVILAVEGEKDVATAEALGLAATCAPGGVGMGWRSTYDPHFAGADVVIIPDSDEDANKGPRYARTIADHLIKVAKRVRWLVLPHGKDITEWREAGGTREALDTLIEGAPGYADVPKPAVSQDAEPQPASNGNDIDDAAELVRLAKLSLLDYDRTRKNAAKTLGLRPSILDAVIKAKRSDLGLDADDGKQGRPIEFREVEPWPAPVDGAALLDDIAAAIGRHVVMAEHHRHAVVLWVTHTYLLDRFHVSPRLAVRSGTKQCGKTVLFDVLEHLVHRPLMAASFTPAVIFRVVEKHRACLLLDEGDNSVQRDGNEELKAILNSGHRWDGNTARIVGDDNEPRQFSTFGAVAVAFIGELYDTLADRSVTIDMKRRLPSEPITEFRRERAGHLDELARKVVRFAQDHAEAIGACEPQMPAGIINRQADNWRPLVAIADVAGGEWPKRARDAASAACAVAEAQSLIELLLGDVRDILDATGVDRISSVHLVEHLVAIVPRPWAEYGKGGKPITANKLARLLKPKPMTITPQVLRIGDETPSGYYRHQFEDAWKRYLPHRGDFKPQHLNKCDGMGTSEPSQTSTGHADVEVSKCKKSNNDGLCLGVEVGKGDLEGSEHAEGGNGPAPGLSQRVTFFGTEPFAPCAHCGKTDGVIHHVRDNRHLDRPSVNLHEACVNPWLACQENGQGEGLSQRSILDLARWYIEQADAQRQGTGDVDSTALGAGLRQVLAEQVLPEFIEVEFQRVMAEVFRV